MPEAAVRRATPSRKAAIPAWRRSAPRALVEAFEADDVADFVRALRKEPPFADIGRAASRAATWHEQALWSQQAFPGTDRSQLLAELLADASGSTKSSRKARERRARRIGEALDRLRTGAAPNGFELLACASLLLREPQLDDDLVLRLWRFTWNGMQRILETPPQLAGRLTPDQRAVLLGEVPWTYGILFHRLRDARQARSLGAEQLRRELQHLCDEEGMPHAAHLDRLSLCLAPFTRAAALGSLAGDDWRNRDARLRYKQLVLRTTALLRPDGGTALGSEDIPPAAGLLQAAARAAAFKKSHRAALLAATVANSNSTKRKELHRTSVAPRFKRKHRPGSQSDSAELACLRNNWGIGADTCTIAFDGANPRIELSALGAPVLSGEWNCSTSLDKSAPLDWSAKWECVCWFSDSTADYVELQQSASDGRRLLRQALLSRDDHFLLLCDIIDAGGNEGIEHTLSLPLVSGASGVHDALTREWSLRCGPLKARVIPLALPQESIQKADGRLTVGARGLTLTGHSSGSRLACPVLVDWSPARRKAAVQWKRLTVAENGRAVSAAEAVGMRWRIGDAQWLYFHTLDGSDASRTVLGHHTFHETVIAEVDSSGEIEQLVEVENPALD